MNKTGRLKKNGLWESNWIVHTILDSGTKTGRFRTRANEYFQTSDPTEPGPKQFWKSRTNSGLLAWPGQICWNPPFVHDLTSLKSKILELKFYLKKNFHKLISVDQMVRILKRILIFWKWGWQSRWNFRICFQRVIQIELQCWFCCFDLCD